MALNKRSSSGNCFYKDRFKKFKMNTIKTLILSSLCIGVAYSMMGQEVTCDGTSVCDNTTCGAATDSASWVAGAPNQCRINECSNLSGYTTRICNSCPPVGVAGVKYATIDGTQCVNDNCDSIEKSNSLCAACKGSTEKKYANPDKTLCIEIDCSGTVINDIYCAACSGSASNVYGNSDQTACVSKDCSTTPKNNEICNLCKGNTEN